MFWQNTLLISKEVYHEKKRNTILFIKMKAVHEFIDMRLDQNGKSLSKLGKKSIEKSERKGGRGLHLQLLS
jgi:hypothetical protein